MRRVLLVDDHELLAGTLAAALAGRGYEVRHEQPSSAEGLVAAAVRFDPEIVLLDFDLGPRMGSSLPLIQPLANLGARVVMLTAQTDRRLLAECVQAGADGLLTKSGPLDDVVQAIEDVAENGSLLSRQHKEQMLAELHHHREQQRKRHAPFARLTGREQEVLMALVDGKTAQTIAQETFTSIRTVRGHIQAILDKLDVNSQVTAVAKARAAGWPGSETSGQH